jgi:hypothetical protein
VAVSGLIRAVACLLTGRGVEPEFSAQGAKAIDPLRTRAGLEDSICAFEAPASSGRLATRPRPPIVMGTTRLVLGDAPLSKCGDIGVMDARGQKEPRASGA